MHHFHFQNRFAGRLLLDLFAVLLLVFSASCQSPQQRSPDGLDPQIATLLQKPTMYLEADRIESVLLGSAGAGRNVEGFRVIKQGPDLTAAQKARLQQLIATPTAYDFKHTKKCPFLPGVGFIFHKNGQTSHAAISFSCSLWSFGSGSTGRIEDFDGVHSELLALAREVFPDQKSFSGENK